MTSWFEVETLGDVFSLVETAAASSEAAARVPVPAPQPVSPDQPARARDEGAGVSLQFWSPAWRQAVRRQGSIFAERYVRLFSRDRSALLFSLGQGVAVALLAALAAPSPLHWDRQGGATTMFVIGCAVVWFGMINSVRELVKERAIWRREQLVGGIVPAYLGSKVAVLAVLAAFQSVTVIICLALTIGLPEHGPIGAPAITMGITLWLANMAGITTGLLVSALAPNSDRAMSIVPYLLIPQLVLSGVLFKLGGLTVASFFVASRWSVSGLRGRRRRLVDEAVGDAWAVPPLARRPSGRLDDAGPPGDVAGSYCAPGRCSPGQDHGDERLTICCRRGRPLSQRGDNGGAASCRHRGGRFRRVTTLTGLVSNAWLSSEGLWHAVRPAKALLGAWLVGLGACGT